MIDIERWGEIYQTLTRHRLRTALTAFGVFWGIFMLVVLLAAGKGLENGIVGQLGHIQNAVFVWSGSPTQRSYAGLATGRRIQLSEADIEFIESRGRGNVTAFGRNRLGSWGSAQYVTRSDNSGSFTIRGTHPELQHIDRLKMFAGRFINAFDMKHKRKVAVVGSRVRDELFEPNENPIGANIDIFGVPFQVVGIAGSFDPGEDARHDLESIYIPNRTLRYTYNEVNRFDSLTLLVSPGVDAGKMEEQIRTALRERHKIHPEDKGVLGSFNAQQEFNKLRGLFSGIRGFSWVVALGTILAGAVGVGNIMLIVVRERTREIGLRKALGATPGSIVAMVVQESLVLTTVAGYFGLVVGVALTETLQPLFTATPEFRNPEIDFTTALLALAVLVISGLIAAWLPASRAAAVNPIIALQDE